MSDTPDALRFDANTNTDDDAPRPFTFTFSFVFNVTANPSDVYDVAENYADAVADFISDGGPVGVVEIDVDVSPPVYPGA